MDWVSAGKGSAYVEMSSNGYYGISKAPAPLRRMYIANHIPALWAKPEYIGMGADLPSARSICEQHSSKR